MFFAARHVLTSTLIVLTPLVAACGTGNGEVEEPTEGVSTTPDAAPAARGADAPLDACALFTTSEAEAVLGETVGEPDQRQRYEGEPTQGAVTSDCGYTAEGSDRGVSVLVRRSPVADNTPEAIERTRAMTAEFATTEPEDVADLGDEAFWVSLGAMEQAQLHVFEGGHLYLTASASGFESAKAALERAKQAARAVLEDL